MFEFALVVLSNDWIVFCLAKMHKMSTIFKYFTCFCRFDDLSSEYSSTNTGTFLRPIPMLILYIFFKLYFNFLYANTDISAVSLILALLASMIDLSDFTSESRGFPWTESLLTR